MATEAANYYPVRVDKTSEWCSSFGMVLKLMGKSGYA